MNKEQSVNTQVSVEKRQLFGDFVLNIQGSLSNMDEWFSKKFSFSNCICWLFQTMNEVNEFLLWQNIILTFFFPS